MSVLVIADQQGLTPATLSTISAATKLADNVDVLVASHDKTSAEQVARINGITKVISAVNKCFEHPLAEDMAALIEPLAKNYTHILAPANTFGKNFTPRLAAKLDSSQISDITAVESADTFVRPIYAANAFITVQSSDTIKVITVRPTAFEQATLADEKTAEIQSLDYTSTNTQSKYIKQAVSESDRPELTSAKIVVSGGRGLQNAENFQLIERLADQLGAAVGASRAAVDAGFIANDHQVGQTGKVVAPDLYIAIGISGAIQHLAGIKDSKVIVAINKDPDAPIFEVADYGLEADFFDILPDLESGLEKLGYMRR